MSVIGSLEDKITKLCKDPEDAMALFLRAFTRGKDNEFVWRNAERYGLDEKKLEEVLDSIDSLKQDISSVQEQNSKFSKSQEFEKILKRVASECVEKFSSELESVAKKNINDIQDSDIKTLVKYAAYLLRVLKRPYSGNEKVFEVRSSSGDILTEILCVILQRRDCVEKENDFRTFVRTVLAKTGIAFYYRSWDNPSRYSIPPYAIKIIDELAKEAEEDLKNGEPTGILSALLIMLNGGKSQDIFEAVYGVDPNKHLANCELCYKGHVSYLIGNIAIELAKGYFEKIYGVIGKALAEKGFRTIIVHEPKVEQSNKSKSGGYHYAIYYTILATRPEHYNVTIHILPFPYTLPPKSGDIEVIILKGPVSNPRYFKNYIVVEMDKNFEKVIYVSDNVKANWSKEIAEIFESLKNSDSILLTPTAVLSAPRSPSIANPINNIRSLDEKDILNIEARNILEKVVAKVLKDLGFDVKLNLIVKDRKGNKLEIDVWASKKVQFLTLGVYVSCKNSKDGIDPKTVEEEFDRVERLSKTQYIPHIKFLVSSKFKNQAKDDAIAKDLVPIELGFQVNNDNIRDAYEKVYQAMSRILGERLTKVSEELKRISNELSRLTSMR